MLFHGIAVSTDLPTLLEIHGQVLRQLEVLMPKKLQHQKLLHHLEVLVRQLMVLVALMLRRLPRKRKKLAKMLVKMQKLTQRPRD